MTEKHHEPGDASGLAVRTGFKRSLIETIMVMTEGQIKPRDVQNETLRLLLRARRHYLRLPRCDRPGPQAANLAGLFGWGEIDYLRRAELWPLRGWALSLVTGRANVRRAVVVACDQEGR